MQDGGWGLIKWVAALVVMGGIVAYAVPGAVDAFRSSVRFGDADASESEATEPAEGESPPAAAVPEAPPPPSGPVADGNAVAQADVSVTAGVVTGVSAPDLRIGPDAADTILVSFPLIQGDPRCVEAARLEIEVISATPTELAAHPSGLFDLAALVEGEPPPRDPVLDQAAQALALTDGSPGRLQWDVTGLYRRWALGEPFQGDQRAPGGTPFVVAVRPSDPSAVEGRNVVFAASEAGPAAPTLSWIGIDGCGG